MSDIQATAFHNTGTEFSVAGRLWQRYTLHGQLGTELL